MTAPASKASDHRALITARSASLNTILEGLDVQVAIVFPGRGELLASHIFGQFVSVPDYLGQLQILKERLPLDSGRREWFSYLIDAIARCVDASRLMDNESCWVALLHAQGCAGQALATLTPALEGKHEKVVRAHSLRDARTEKNEPIKRFVLDQASRLRLKTVGSAASHIAKQFTDGGHQLEEFGSDLKLPRLEKTFGDYISRDMVAKGLKAEKQKVTQQENARLFAEWKKLYASDANG